MSEATMDTVADEARIKACRKAQREYQRKNRARVKMARLVMPDLYATLRAAYKRGEVFYNVEHVSRSGMSRNITLHAMRRVNGKMELSILWPDCNPLDRAYSDGRGEVAARLGKPLADLTDADIRAFRKAWTDTFKRIGFSYRTRTFQIGGCGMDMVFALMDHLGHVFGFEDAGNKVRRYSLSRS